MQRDLVLSSLAKSKQSRLNDEGDRYFLLDDCIQALRSALEAGQDDVLRFFLSQRNSVTTVCEAFEQSGLAATAETLNRSCNRAKLSQEEALLLGAALTQASNETWQKAGVQFLKSKLEQRGSNGSSLDQQLLLQQLLLPVKHVQGLQNAAAAAKLYQPTSSSSSSSSAPGASPSHTSSGLSGVASSQLAAVLRGAPAEPVDTLPPSGHPAGRVPAVAAMPTVLAAATRLSLVMQELGYGCTAHDAVFKAVLCLVPAATLTPQAVAEVLGLMARTHRGLDSDSAALTASLGWALSAARLSPADLHQQTTWNTAVVVDGIKAAAPGLNWQQVAECLDYEGFLLPDAPGLRVLMMAYKRATPEPFPLKALLGRVWTNSAGQLSFLTQAVAAPPDLFTFAHSAQRVGPLEGLHVRNPVGGPNQAWASIDLLALLAQLSEAGHWPAMQSILDQPLKTCPEVLLVTTACVRRKEQEAHWSPLEQYVWGAVAPPYFTGHAHSAALVRILHERASPQLVTALGDWYAQDVTRVARVLELLQQEASLNLNSVLHEAPPALAVDLACLAARREHLHLEKWVKERLAADVSQGGGYFIVGAIAMLDQRLEQQAKGSSEGPRPPVISVEALAVFLRCFAAAGLPAEPGLRVSLGRLYNSAMAAFPQQPQQQVLTQAASSGRQGGPPPAAFPGEVEAEANDHFQRIYSQNKPVAEVVDLLNKYRNSGVEKDQQVFACMVHNLFDEYRFFQNYPDKELNITAALFGSLLQYHMISGITLGMALRYMRQALAAPAGTKLFRFGLGALQQCRGVLGQWPQFCALVVQVAQVRAADPALVQQLEAIVQQSGGAAQAGSTAVAAVANAALASDGDLATLSSQQQQQQSTSGPDISGIRGMFDNQPAPSTKHTSFSGLRLSNGSVGAGDGAGPSAAAAAAGGGSGAPAGAAASSSQQQKTSTNGPTGAAGGRGQQGAAGSVRGKAADVAVHQSVGSERGDEAAVADLLSDSTAAQATANMALNEKPAEKLSLHMTTNNETLELAERSRPIGKPPSDAASDKVSFIMNNLSQNNVDVKARDLAHLLVPHHVDWFANYLVVKRAAQEPNHHPLYVSLMDAMRDRELPRIVLATTYYYSKALLSSDRAITQTNERTLIKQLGQWLGLQTFARNKPVLAKDMDLKEMIKEAYMQGRMVAVLPFVEKVLAGCTDSKVFRATNPMIAGLLSLLAEIHAIPRLKLNHCFVIEVTLRTFKLTVADVIPSSLLAGLQRPQFNNPDFTALANEGIPGQASAFDQQQATTASFTQGTSLAAATAAATAPGAAAPSPTQPQRPGMAPSTPVDASKLPPGAAASPAAATPAAPAVAASPAAAAPPSAAGTPGMPSPAPGMAPGMAMSPGGPGAPPLTPVPGPAAPTTDFRPDKLHSYVVVHPQLQPYIDRLALKRLLPIALDRAICEIIAPVVERSVTIACMTTFELVTKDYAVDPDETRLRAAAQAMVSSLAGSLALVTCKEPLRVSLNNQLRTMLQQQQLAPDFLEQAVGLLVQDNLELGCTFIEKAATDRALRDVDKALAAQYEARILARQRNLPFPERNPYALVAPGRFPGALPESLQPKPGQAAQQRVYEDFTRLPKVAPMATRAEGAAGAQDGAEGGAMGDKPMLPDTAVAQGQMVDAYLRWTAGLDQVAANDPPAHADVEKLLGDMEKLVNGNDKVAHFVAQRLARKVFESTNKVAAVLTADALRMCAVAAGPNGVKLVAQEVTAAWGGLQHAEARFNKDIAELLIRRQLLNLPDVDQALAKGLTLRLNGAIEFGITLAKACREGLCGASDISNTLDLLAKVTSDMQGGQQVLQLLAAARASSRARAAERAGLPDLAGLREKADPQGLHQQVAGLFEEFARRCMAAPDDKVHSVFVQQLRSTGLLNLDDTTDRMLRILVELAVQHCLQNESAGPPRADGSLLPGPLSFLAVDPLVKLVVCLTTQHGGSEKFLGRTLSVTAALVRRDAEDKGLEFNCRPYLRLLVGLATEVGGGEAAIGSTPEPGSMRLLRLIGLTLLALQPTTVPGFAFAYLELLSHRSFMPRLLMAPQQGGWQLFEALLVGLLQFLEPGLRAAELTEPLRLLYKGTLRLLLVLLHDFPEFLCEHHFNLCDVIPAPAIQMRNLILSAFPRNMRLPDPFTPNLKVDLLPEINNPPRGTPPPEALLPPPVRSTVDALLAGRAPASALPQLVAWLGLPLEQRALGGNYNVPLINALVLYLASTSTPGAPVLPSSPAMELISRLAADLDPEGTYLLLNGIANQLRYPNSHTHYFSCVLLMLFAEAPAGAAGEAVQAQVTRVLLERLIVNRPHPWGLLITFIELIKNPHYKFWSHSFTRCAPDIERLFESVARSCMGPMTALPQQAAAGAKAGEVEEVKG